MRFKIPAKQPANFKASALYLAGRTKGQSPERVAWMEVRNLETEDPHAAAAIMEATAAQNLRCEKPIYHFVVSFDPEDAKRGKVPPEVMREIAGKTLDRLSLNEYQTLIYAHKDTEHPHIHFLVNRIHPRTGKAFSRHNDGRNLSVLCREVALEYGLNVPRNRERIHEKERVDDFDVLSVPKQQPTQDRVPGGEYWQARREERMPQHQMEKESVQLLREKVAGYFYNAKDWHDLTARLGAQGVYLQRKGQGLILTKGEHYAKLSQMGKNVRLLALEERFGERFDTFINTRIRELAKAEAPGENIASYEAMSPAEQRRAEKLFNARKAVARKKGNSIQELAMADLDYRYWSGVQASYRATERRIVRLEREKDWLEKTYLSFEKREQKAKATFALSFVSVFRNPSKAQEIWKKLEISYGAEDALRMIRNNPRILGQMNGRSIFGKDSDTRKKAKQAFRYLGSKRQKWRETLLKLGNHRNKIEANRRALRIALNDFKMMKLRTDVPYALKRIMLDKVRRRERALSRVTDRAIRESKIAEDRKLDLIRARERYLQRRKELERRRTLER